MPEVKCSVGRKEAQKAQESEGGRRPDGGGLVAKRLIGRKNTATKRTLGIFCAASGLKMW